MSSITQTVILNAKQIEQIINRLAYQIYEDCADETSIVLAGIAQNGLTLANRLIDKIHQISNIKCEFIEIEVDKKNPHADAIKLNMDINNIAEKAVILVDDVLNSGKTLIYALNPFLDIPTKKIRTTILVDRNHKNFPVSADFVGISLATTMQEHITVQFGEEDVVYLS